MCDGPSEAWPVLSRAGLTPIIESASVERLLGIAQELKVLSDWHLNDELVSFADQPVEELGCSADVAIIEESICFLFELLGLDGIRDQGDGFDRFIDSDKGRLGVRLDELFECLDG